MKQTRIIISAIVFMLSVSCGCTVKDAADDVPGKSSLRLTYPSNDDDSRPKIRFDSQKKTDERSLAYERIAEEWNRNLMVGNRICPADETSEPYSGHSQK